MANKYLTVSFQCTLTQLAGAAQRTLGLRNMIEPDSIIGNLLHVIPNSDAIQSAWCRCEEDDACTVFLRNHTAEDTGEPTSEPSDATEFHKAAKALQDVIFFEQPANSVRAKPVSSRVP